MKWINKWKLPAIEAIKYNGQLCLNINDLWQALHLSFNTALHCSVNISILNEIDSISPLLWNPFSKEKFKITISSCNNSSSLDLDKLSWSHLKPILRNNECLINIIRIANSCIDLGYWLSHFKKSTTVIIPKPNKISYNNPKSFRPIVLLNTISKLIKKVIGNRLQFHVALNSFIHPSQLGGLKFKSMTDVGAVLTHIICSG